MDGEGEKLVDKSFDNVLSIDETGKTSFQC